MLDAAILLLVACAAAPAKPAEAPASGIEPAPAPEPEAEAATTSAAPRWEVPIHLESQRTVEGRLRAQAADLDASGTVLVGGIFAGEVNLGGGPLVSAGESGDLFLAAWNAEESLRFSTRLGAPGADYTRGVALGPDGTAWIAQTCDPADVAADPQRPCTLATGFGPDGVERSAIRSSVGLVSATHLAVQADGDVLVAGRYGEGAAIEPRRPLPPGKGFVARFDRRGRVRWTRVLGNSPTAFALAPDGSIVVGGSGDAPLGEGWPDALGSGPGFIARLDRAGVPIFVRRIDAPNLRVASVSVDAEGEICAGGFVGSREVPLDVPLQTDAFVGSFTRSGEPRWSRTFGGEGIDDVLSVSIGADRRCYVTGVNGGWIDFGDGPIRPPLVRRDGEEERYPISGLLVASFASSGEVRWALSENGGNGFAIVVLGEDHVLVTGRSSGGEGLPEELVGPPVPEGMFLRRYAPGADPGAAAQESRPSLATEPAEEKPPEAPEPP